MYINDVDMKHNIPVASDILTSLTWFDFRPKPISDNYPATPIFLQTFDNKVQSISHIRRVEYASYLKPITKGFEIVLQR